jgi:hypothetical protein
MRLAQANVCGAVYGLHLDSNYTAVDMFPLVAGTPLTMDYGAGAESPDYDGINKCDVNGIANPDNVTYMPGYNTLIIGEDTGSGHQNDMIWSYDLSSGTAHPHPDHALWLRDHVAVLLSRHQWLCLSDVGRPASLWRVGCRQARRARSALGLHRLLRLPGHEQVIFAHL